jgi:hypothetical protein
MITIQGGIIAKKSGNYEEVLVKMSLGVGLFRDSGSVQQIACGLSK